MHCVRRTMDQDVSAQLCLLACFILTVDLTLGLGSNQDMQFTFLLPAGSTECFYQTTMSNDSMEVEYQVIAGSGLDVGFALISPSGHRLVSDFRKSDGMHMVDPTEDGDYRLCFDNSFSKLSEKMVFFEVIINSQSSTGRGREEWADMAATESMAEYKLEDIRARMEFVYQQLERSRQVQTVLRAFEARDRYLLEDNLWRVSFWSCLNLLVMLTVAVTQIYTLRRLFDDTKRTRT
ncbi:transmembrane emp24 domain-containing protein 1-like [Seriola lalandi dorsalis]|uniref:Transmembrane p24 trafficking protein 1a n=1 Tax=Seriola lalandi dorsalis TaxID=1841481 RepID=A0A3B4WID1_SERLL|nr:transmembrane emp24 domain-containing protein 1-like [Seriola lalandi dorsalis]XP_056256405.1 transmembrane emp24 domain-containing protein 1a [Seriola aureovittata]